MLPRTLALAAFMCALVSCTASRNAPAPAVASEQPVACALAPEELKARRDALLPGLLRKATEVTELENGLRLRFDTQPGLLAELTRIIEQERTCCSFLRFQLTIEPGAGPIVFDVTGPKGTRELLRAL